MKELDRRHFLAAGVSAVGLLLIGGRIGLKPPHPPHPTRKPTPTPSPIGTASPTASASGSGTPFLGYPRSAAITRNGLTDVVIENLSFVGLGAGVQAVRLENVKRVTVRHCDFDTVAEAIFALNSEDVVVEDCRYRNITGPAKPRTSTALANFVQFNKVHRGVVRRNKGIGGDTEDIVSIYQSGGDSGTPLLVEDNWFEGTNWTSNSGSGIALSDNGGAYNIARRNRLLNPGQVGIFIAGGQHCEISDNVIYGAQRPASNVGVYVWDLYNTNTCGNHLVANNQVRWYRADGAENPFWNAGDCSPLTITGNDWHAALDPVALHVVL